jgi:hypothetical protein
LERSNFVKAISEKAPLRICEHRPKPKHHKQRSRHSIEINHKYWNCAIKLDIDSVRMALQSTPSKRAAASPSQQNIS